MAKSTYSFGEESPLKFKIPDKMAEYYNQALAEWFKAQQRFNQKHGRKWDPTKDPIKLRWNRQQRKAWNDFADVFNAVIAREGPFHVNDIMEDFLVKNVSAAVSKTSDRWGQALPIAVMGGVLYVLLRGLQEHSKR